MKKNNPVTGRSINQEPEFQKLPFRSQNLKDLYNSFVDKQEQVMPLQGDYSQTELRILQQSGIPLSEEPNHSTKELIEQFQARLNKTLKEARKKAEKQTKSGRPSDKNLDDRRSKAKASRKARRASR